MDSGEGSGLSLQFVEWITHELEPPMNMSFLDRFLYAPWESLSLRERIGVWMILLNAYIGFTIVLSITISPHTIMAMYMPDFYMKAVEYSYKLTKEYSSLMTNKYGGIVYLMMPVFAVTGLVQFLTTICSVTILYVIHVRESIKLGVGLFIIIIQSLCAVLMLFPVDNNTAYAFVFDYRLGIFRYVYFLFCIHVATKLTIVFTRVVLEKFMSKE